MRITKYLGRWSPFWGPKMQKKYGFETYYPAHDKDQPVIVFGCYARGTKTWIMNHRGLCVIVWSGSDSTRLHEHADFVHYCRQNADRVFHIAHSHWIQVDLAHFGFKFIDRVVTPTDFEGFQYESERGEYVYHYGSPDKKWYYGTHIINKLEAKWSKNQRFPNFIKTTQAAYKHDELYEKYKQSFLGVRLTEHDNMAMSVVEMGLMGRRSIFNGDVPCAIPYPCPPYDRYEPETRNRWVWQDESLVGIVGKMILEYRDRYGYDPDPMVAEEMREFVYDDREWLNTEYYDKAGE